MRKELSNEEIVARIEQCESASYGIFDAELSKDRAEAFQYYVGEPFGNEVEGRSQVVSRDVLDVIESALPQLLKVFVSGDEVVRFQPRSQQDEKAAEQETAAVNYFVTEKNDGFRIFYVWFKDALLSKNGYVKCWYEDNEEVTTESYQGLTDEQMTLLIKDDRVEVVEHSEYPDEIDAQQRQEALQNLNQQLQQATQQATMNPQAGQAVQQMQMQMQQIQSQPPKNLHDVKITVTETRGCIKIENVAPEDILVGQDTCSVSLEDANFVQHRALMDRHEIEANGWEIPDGAQENDIENGWEEQNSRDLYGENDYEDTLKRFLVKDTYYRIDGTLYRFVVIGNQVVHEEEAEVIPFVSITPHLMPHRHIGMSYADLTKDIQLIKSTLLRGQLDAMYLANQPRWAIDTNRVSLEDMLVSRPGGVVRVSGDPGVAMFPLQTPTFPPTSFTLVEYLDSAKEKRTGVTAYNQGLDANSLNKTATGVNQIMQAAQQRIELVARTFANTGIKDLFILVHRLLRTYYTRPEVIRLRGEWVNIDPREWKERKDLQISVGLGTGNKDAQLMHLGTILQQQMGMLQAGLPIVNPQNIYETMRQIAMNAGFKQPELFVTDPKTVPPPGPPPENPVITVKKMELQADQQKFQAQAQLDQQKFQAQAQIDQQKMQADLEQEQLRSQNDVAIEQHKINQQMELERYKAQLEAETTLRKAQMEIEAKIMLERHSMEMNRMATQ